MDGGPTKKRLSDCQITKDDGDGDGDDQGDAGRGVGTFQRADDSVLAGRRIVKARRPGSGAGAGAGLAAASVAPFAAAPKQGLYSGFSFFQQQAPRSPAPAAVGDSEAGGGLEDRREEADLDPRGRPVPPPPDPEEEEGPPHAAEAGVTEAPDSDSDDVSSAPRKPGPSDCEVLKGEEGGGVEDDGKEVEDDDEGGEGEGEGGGKKMEPKGQARGFANLSSAPNAFSNAFGGGTFGGSTFTFGASEFVKRSAAPTPAASPAPGTSAGPRAPSAFPSLSTVFGGASNAKVHLFGVPVGDADGAAPAAASAPALVNLPPVDVVTGEEEERPLFAAEAVLFEFVEGGKWKERGKGEVRLNSPDKSARPPRLVMRARGNLRLLLNANLFPSMKVSKMNGKGVSFACVNSAEETGEGESGASASMKTLALRFKEASLAAELLELIDKHKVSLKGVAGAEAAQENGRSHDAAAKDNTEGGAKGAADAAQGRDVEKGEGDVAD